MKKLSIGLAIGTLALASLGHTLEQSGRIGIESRQFYTSGENQQSLLAEPELYWYNGNHSVTVELFGRIDSLDDERTHADIREAMWLYASDSWELSAGIGKVYWGVTESNHLVDIINQTDLVESVDGEQKLGQAMLQYTRIMDWGVVDAFVLPVFRERTFAGPEGNLVGPLPVNTDLTQYEDQDKAHHIDYALRYSHSVSVFDVGVSWFEGTNRDPRFNLVQHNGTSQFQPFYDQISHIGLDVQATVGDWLWKLEAIDRQDSVDHFQAVTAGFEYTLIGVFNSAIDLGLLAEYSRDSRGDKALTPLENDLFAGARLTFNDTQSTELLLGISHDMDRSESYLAFIEGSRRIGNDWKLTLDARAFNSTDTQSDFVLGIKDDDYASFTLEWFY